MEALVIIDVQNDFCKNGALEVPEAHKIIPVINRLAENFDVVVQTQDWHPAGHSSFASQHAGKADYETVEMPYGEQVLWPDHCVQGSRGAEFHPDLNTDASQLIIRKGFRKSIDSYSAFYENDQLTPTGLKGFLNERNIDRLYIAGLAADFCVKWAVLDGLKEGFEVVVVEDAVKGIDLNGSLDQAWTEMKKAGAKSMASKQIEKSL
jgi:nicotinamidase/pyrazinamidase